MKHADWIAARLAQTSELTLSEVREEMAGRGVPVSYASVWRMVRRLEAKEQTASEQGPFTGFVHLADAMIWLR